MAFENRNWVIVTLADHDEPTLALMVENAIESSLDTLRKTNDGKKALMKFDGPGNILFNGMKKYNHSEILTELAKAEWNPVEESGGGD